VWTAGSLGFVLCFVALLLLREAPVLPLLIGMVIAQGFGYGVTSVFGAIPAEIFEGRQYGMIFGSLMLASVAGGATGPWVTGALYDLTGSYAAGFAIAIVSSAVSIAAIWRAAPRKVRAVAGHAAARAARAS
jgi:hypothetical protein